MPRFDLRKNKTVLDPLAPFNVLSVMCHPNDPIRRERMMALLHSQTGNGRSRRRALTDDEFMREVNLTARRGRVAGHFLMTMLQLRNEGLTPSFNRALPLVIAEVPKWDDYCANYWTSESHVEHHPRSRRKLLDAFRAYRPVAHLWAAMTYGLQHERDDVWPGSLATLPTFLAYADAFLDMGCGLPSHACDRRFVLSRSDAWTFSIPESANQSVTLQPLPLEEAQWCTLNEHRPAN